jgi:hypothetical protein
MKKVFFLIALLLLVCSASFAQTSKGFGVFGFVDISSPETSKAFMPGLGLHFNLGNHWAATGMYSYASEQYGFASSQEAGSYKNYIHSYGAALRWKPFGALSQANDHRGEITPYLHSGLRAAVFYALDPYQPASDAAWVYMGGIGANLSLNANLAAYSEVVLSYRFKAPEALSNYLAAPHTEVNLRLGLQVGM